MVGVVSKAMPEAHLDGGFKGCNRALVGTKGNWGD